MARKWPVGTSMTRPVRTSTICRGGTVTSCAAARSKPADSSVPYAGRVTVESSRLILSRIGAAYLLVAVTLVVNAAAVTPLGAQTSAAPGPAAAGASAPLPLDPAIRTGKLPNGLTYFIRKNGKPENRAL